jgi:chromate transporter
MNTLLSLLLSFGKIGLISLGGGNSMLKLIEVESVNYQHWVSPTEFVSMTGSTFIFPGLTAVKLSALIGYKVAGIAGLLIAVLSLNLPGLILAILGYHWMSNLSQPFGKKLMVAVQYGALALLAAATFSIAQGIVSAYFSYPIALACFLFFIGLAFLNISPFWGFLAFIGVSFFLVRS